MDQAGENTQGSSGNRKTKWIVVLLLLLVVAGLVMKLPRGFSDDLTRIGKGKVAVVLVRDKNATQSFDLMDVLNSVRDQYSDRAEFLLTDFNTPEGRAFMSTNDAAKVTVVVFDAQGNKVNILYPPQTDESMRQAIDAALQVAK